MKSKNNIKPLLKLIEDIQKVKILKDSILIIGLGKFGKTALDYACVHKIPYIFIIDNNPKLKIPETAFFSSDLHEINLLVKKIYDTSTINSKSKKSNIYFLKTDFSIIELIFSMIIPEKIVPVVPYHVFGHYIKKKLKNTKTITINQDDFEKIVKSIPKEIILNTNHKQGIISLSYAYADELCPENCFGPTEYCPNFNRKKPKTITEIVISLEVDDLIKLVIESEQLDAGLGFISGEILKNGLIDFYQQVYLYIMNKKKNRRVVS